MTMATRDCYGTDAVGVRRLIVAGSEIPAGLTLEEDSADAASSVYRDLSVEDLVAEADRLKIMVEGSGRGGSVIKGDLVSALVAHGGR